MGVNYCVKSVAIVGNTDCYSQCTSSFHWSSTALEESCTFSARQDKNLPWSDSSGIKITVVVDTFPSGLICKIKDKSIYTVFQVWLNLDTFLEYSAHNHKSLFKKANIFEPRLTFLPLKIGENFRFTISNIGQIHSLDNFLCLKSILLVQRYDPVEKLIILKWRFRFASLYFLHHQCCKYLFTKYKTTIRSKMFL